MFVGSVSSLPSGTRLVGLGTLHTSFGAMSDTPAGSPCGWNPIGDKPGRETCVVSQVVADSLARLPLEGCRDTRCAHGGKWRERV